MISKELLKELKKIDKSDIEKYIKTYEDSIRSMGENTHFQKDLKEYKRYLNYFKLLKRLLEELQ